jgi:ATP-dependent RNA helicase DeaD
MESFEDLGLGPELVEALIAEGIEVPSALQHHAIPLLRRGNAAILRAGPGAGTLVAYGAPLLDRIPAGSGTPAALVLTPTRARATALARSLGRLGLATGHRCAALGGPWALPGHADVLFGTPTDLQEAIRLAEVKLEGVGVLVLEGAGALLETPGDAARVEGILQLVAGGELQVILAADPLTPTVRAFADEHVRRAVFLPPEAAGEEVAEAPVARGVLRVVPDDGATGESPLVSLVAHLLDGEVHHALVYFRSEDAAADTADLLLVHGYMAGSPGDPETPVWLGLDPLEARRAVEVSGIPRERIASISADVPTDVDSLDRRHGGGRTEGVVLAAARELPHLRRLAREAGYRLDELRLEPPGTVDAVHEFRLQVEEALAAEDLGAYLTLLEPLLQRWTGAEVAAALAAILRRSPTRPGAVEEPSDPRAVAPAGARPPAWARLFLSVGSRDGVGPGDLLGAITGEAGLEGGQVGRIDIRDTFSRVEVEDAHAQRVIRALNGITIRGRSVRADFDRGEQRRGRHGRGEPRG